MCDTQQSGFNSGLITALQHLHCEALWLDLNLRIPESRPWICHEYDACLHIIMQVKSAEGELSAIATELSQI